MTTPVFPAEIDKYQLTKRLGGGSFGEVYLAHDRALSKNAAIKIIQIQDANKIPELLAEAQIMYSCKHKNVVEISEANIFSVGTDHYLIFSLEYLPEGSLESELSARWISAREGCTRISHVLSGLQYAHSKGYLHRDIKPGNILMCGSSTKLSDFGLASIASLCFPGMLAYHPHKPPEYFAAQPPDISSDIYAIGLTLFRISNNYTDWRTRLAGLTNIEDILKKGTLISKVGYQEFVPKKVRRIINKACNFDSTKRFQSASEMQNSLDALRYNVDWRLISYGNWSGQSADDAHEMNIDSKKSGFHLNYKKNGRNVTAKSNVFSTYEKAIEFQYEIAADESII